MDLFPFSAIRTGDLTLYPIEKANFRDVRSMLAKSKCDSILDEYGESYCPEYGDVGKRTKWGFHIRKNGSLCGLVLLGIRKDDAKVGYTGADILPNWKGQGI